MYLYKRFVFDFSGATYKHIITIASLMLVENACNGILRFFVGVKLLLEDHTRYGEALNFLFPVFYACFWLHVYNIASTKNGHYGAPPGLIKHEEKYEDTE